jgi:hypothetical protein
MRKWSKFEAKNKPEFYKSGLFLKFFSASN